MKWIVLFGLNLIIFFQAVLSSSSFDDSIPSPPCCHSQCCCSQCPRESCLRPPEDSPVLHPCSCDQTVQYSCTQNPNPMFPTLIPPFPINYPLPPYPNNQYPRPYPRGPQYPNPQSYPIVIVPEQQRPPIRRPFPKPDYLKPCLCGGNVAPSCQQTFPCGIDQNNNNYNYGSWISWDSWNLNFLETPQGIAVLIIAIVLLLLIICLIIGLIIACIRSRKSKVIQTEKDYERHEKLNDNDFQPSQNETKKGRKNRKN